MLSVDDFLGEILEDNPTLDLQHAYDPVRAREYYLKTRKLKGRRKGTEKLPVGRVLSDAENKVERKRALARRIAAKKARNKKLKEEAEARVLQLQARLDKLKDILAELTKQAKARSGIETKSTSKEKAENKKANEDRKPATAAEKKEAAKRAKEAADKKKDGDPSLSDQAKELDAKIAKVRESIAKMKEQIADAKKKASAKEKAGAKSGAKQKTKTASNGR